MVSHRGSNEQACSLFLFRLASSLTPPFSVSLSCLALRLRACKETPDIHALPVLMLRQVFFALFLVSSVGLVLGFLSCALLGGSKTVPEPNMAPTWVDFGAMLGTFWSIFGCSFALFFYDTLGTGF